MVILDGKATSAHLQAQIAAEVDFILDRGGRRPRLTAILVGEDGASQTYVANKERACKKVGFDSTVLRLPASTTERQLLDEVEKLNGDDSVDGFIIQLPLPGHIDEQKIIEAVNPAKDVDGFHPENVGRLSLGLDTFISATPYGIITLLEEYGIKTSGKHCVVLGRSNIVGRPIANLLSAKAKTGDCTVTICHSRTKDIEQYTRSADIIIAALGVPGFLKADMVKEGAVVIDVGITRVPADNEKGYRIMGDVDFDAVAPKCSFITPVPGGVGPMTIVSLMRNTLKAYKAKYETKQ